MKAIGYGIITFLICEFVLTGLYMKTGRDLNDPDNLKQINVFSFLIALAVTLITW